MNNLNKNKNGESENEKKKLIFQLIKLLKENISKNIKEQMPEVRKDFLTMLKIFEPEYVSVRDFFNEYWEFYERLFSRMNYHTANATIGLIEKTIRKALRRAKDDYIWKKERENYLKEYITQVTEHMAEHLEYLEENIRLGAAPKDLWDVVDVATILVEFYYIRGKNVRSN